MRNLDTTLFPDFEHIKFGLFNNKKLGGNYIENFENFWSGDINVVLKNKWVYRRYDLKLVLVFGLDVIIIKLIQKFLSTYTDFHNSVSSFINSLYYYKYLINYVTIEPITFFMICFTIVLIAMTGLYDILFGMIFILLPKFSSTLSVPPKDVQLRVIERYLKGETVIKEQPQVSFVERITRIFRRDSNFENWKIICPICLNDVKGSKVSQCENCSRLFHTDHLNLYMTEFANSGKIPLCPICKTNLNKSAIDAVFS